MRRSWKHSGQIRSRLWSRFILSASPSWSRSRTMPRSRISIALYLILVFASGILVGVVSHRLYATTSTASANNSPQSMGEFRRRYLEGMRKQVGASEAQIVEINKILEDTKKKVDELAASEKPL